MYLLPKSNSWYGPEISNTILPNGPLMLYCLIGALDFFAAHYWPYTLHTWGITLSHLPKNSPNRIASLLSIYLRYSQVTPWKFIVHIAQHFQYFVPWYDCLLLCHNSSPALFLTLPPQLQGVAPNKISLLTTTEQSPAMWVVHKPSSRLLNFTYSFSWSISFLFVFAAVGNLFLPACLSLISHLKPIWNVFIKL